MLSEYQIKAMNLSWQDKQTWECGFTPKCCSCKYAKKDVAMVEGKEQEVWWCHRKRTPQEQSPQYRREGRERKEWNGTCLGHEWKFAEGVQVELEVQN